MTLKQALQEAIVRLDEDHVGSPRLNAETLLMFTLACDRAYLYAHPERELTAAEAERYEQVIAERAGGKPSQYIIGHQEFWGLDFLVSPAVLIPRPETEHVVEAVLEVAPDRNAAMRLADVGTGSGCLALTLAHEYPRAEVHGTDISEEALEIARINRERLDLLRVRFHHCDLLEGLDDEGRFDVIVCNPPYVSEAEPEKVQRQVREFEPKVAVFAGPSGLEIYRRLIPQASDHMVHGGWLVMEIGFSIEAAVRELLTGWSEVRTRNDLQGIPRVLAAKR
jgi:release factor glutamine methyltransferase